MKPKPKTQPRPEQTPEQRARAALVSKVNRTAALKAEHAAELEAMRAKMAQAEANHRHDSLVLIASQRAEAAGLDKPAHDRFIQRVLAEDRKPRPPVQVASPNGAKYAAAPFDIEGCIARLLDEIAKETKGAAGVLDTRKMSRTEYAAYLRKRGLHDPALGSHLPLG